MADYKEFLDKIDRKAYHEGEWQWQGEYTVTRSTQYSAPGCHNSCGVLLYTKDGKLERGRRPAESFQQWKIVYALS